MPRLADFELRTVLDEARLREMRAAVARITLADALIDYIADVMRATRTHPWLEVGASTRAANMLAAAARATAALQGCDFVPPNDVKFVALPVLRRRLVLNAGAEIEGQGADHILRDILDQTPVPR
jgi:MoxR-like ATPase